MSEDIRSFKFDSEILKEEIKPAPFKFEGVDIFKFEDKTPTLVILDDSKEIKSKEETFNNATKLRYYVPVLIKDKNYYWCCSGQTLRMVLDAKDKSNVINVELDNKNKKYNVMALAKK